MRPGQIVGPLILIGIGVLFLLNNLGWHIPIGDLIRSFWPLILVGIGIAQISGALMGRGNVTGGVILLTVGILFLVQQNWDVPVGYVIRTFWPLILIGLGVMQLVGALAGRGNMAGAIVLLTLGVLFSLQQMFDISFRATWPVLLIAIGAIGLLRAMVGPTLFGNRFMRGGVRR